MKNYAEQQMGAVLNPCVNHPEMSRAAEIPEDVMQAAREAHAEFAKSSVSDNLTLIIAKAILGDRQRDQWRPIETAPKDGTDILVADDGRQGVEMVSWKGGAKKGGWHTEDGRASYTTDFFTHWQPLPAPPKVSE